MRSYHVSDSTVWLFFFFKVRIVNIFISISSSCTMTEGSVPTPIYIKGLSVHDLTECEVPCFSGNTSQKKKCLYVEKMQHSIKINLDLNEKYI